MASSSNSLLAIDPGSSFSGVCMLDITTMRPSFPAKIPNELVFGWIKKADAIAIERIASYGMPVGKEVFETCEAIGMFRLYALQLKKPVTLIYRQDERVCLCHSSRANDANIKQALVDRFAPGVRNHGKGTKKEPGFFYGFRADAWSAFAVGVTALDVNAGRYSRKEE